MNKQIEFINEHIKKSILDMLDAVKIIISTELDDDGIKTIEIYLDTIAALVSDDPDAFPEEQVK